MTWEGNDVGDASREDGGGRGPGQTPRQRVVGMPGSREPLPLGWASSVMVRIPRTAAATIVGSEGETVWSIHGESGARVRVGRRDVSGPGAVDLSRPLVPKDTVSVSPHVDVRAVSRSTVPSPPMKVEEYMTGEATRAGHGRGEAVVGRGVAAADDPLLTCEYLALTLRQPA